MRLRAGVRLRTGEQGGEGPGKPVRQRAGPLQASLQDPVPHPGHRDQWLQASVRGSTPDPLVLREQHVAVPFRNEMQARVRLARAGLGPSPLRAGRGQGSTLSPCHRVPKPESLSSVPRESSGAAHREPQPPTQTHRSAAGPGHQCHERPCEHPAASAAGLRPSHQPPQVHTR